MAETISKRRERMAALKRLIDQGFTFSGAEEPEGEAGAGEAPAVVEDAPDAPSAHDWGEHSSEPYAQRFPGGPAAMWEAIQQGTQKITQLSQAQQQAVADQEPEAEPWEPGQDWQAPANVDPVFYGKVAQNYQVDPVGTFRELVQGGDDYAVYTEQVYAALKQQVGEFRAIQLYNQFERERQQAEYEERLESTIAERVAPIENAAVISRVDAGITLARAEIGDEGWAKFEPYLRAHTPAEGFPKHVLQDADLMRDTLVKLRKWQLFEEQDALNTAAAAPTPTPTPTRKGTQATLGGNTASRPDEQSYQDRVKQSLKDTKIRITD